MTASIYPLTNDFSLRLPGRDAKAVVLVGGKGTRLAPYTSVLPKPLMPIGNHSILEIVLRQLHRHGVVDVTLCVGYLSHLIEAVIGDGSAHGASVQYVRESQALGTAAPLRLVRGLNSTFIVMNGDVLTGLDYGALLRHHHDHENLVTIAAKKRQIKIDYGVLHVGSNRAHQRLRRFVEKPEITSRVSMGIYAMEPEALRYIPSEGYFDFPDLIQALLDAGEPVGVSDYDGMWFDIGRPEDYEQAVEAWVTNESEDDDPMPAAIAGRVRVGASE
jgi:NDP-sugar pyrophosphorylase family protein